MLNITSCIVIYIAIRVVIISLITTIVIATIAIISSIVIAFIGIVNWYWLGRKRPLPSDGHILISKIDSNAFGQ